MTRAARVTRHIIAARNASATCSAVSDNSTNLTAIARHALEWKCRLAASYDRVAAVLQR
jgi:hypothetical protein